MTKIVLLLKAIVWELCWRFLFSLFVRYKVNINENISVIVYASGIRFPDCSILGINPKNDNDVIIFWHDVSVNVFWRSFVSLVNFSCWSRFHVNVITGSRVMTILFYKGLTRNPEIGNTSVWVLPNIWRRGQVRDTKFDTNVSNEILLNAAECQSYSFCRFWIIKRKPTVGG